METEGGRNSVALIRELQERAHQFEFFQAVRLMLWLAPAGGGL